MNKTPQGHNFLFLAKYEEKVTCRFRLIYLTSHLFFHITILSQTVSGTGMEHHSEPTFFPLLLVSVLAFLIPIITAGINRNFKILIPAVVGEIICGLIIGQSALGLIPNTESIIWLKFLSLFGFTYLMFLSGLEIDFGMLATEKTIEEKSPSKNLFLDKPLNLGVIYYFATMVMALLISLGLYITGYITNWLFMALVLSTVSVGIVVPILKEKQLLKSYLGQTILICALVADFISMILITVLVTVMKQGLISTTIVTFLLFGLFIFILYRLYLKHKITVIVGFLNYFVDFIINITSATTQLKVRGAIALMIVFIFMSEMLGIEIILGAFIAGILTTAILGKAKTSELEMKLDAIGYGFFIPVFFITVGIDINLRAFFESKEAWILTLILAIAAFVVKIFPSILFKYSFNIRESFSSGVLLVSNLSLPIAAATIGVKDGIITEATNTSIIIMAVTTCIIAPIAFNKIFKQVSEKIPHRIAIIGASDLGIKIAHRLNEFNQEVIMIALSSQEARQAKANHLPVILTGHNPHKALLNLDLEHINTLLVTTDNDYYNLDICIKANHEYKIHNIISLVNETRNIEAFESQKVKVIHTLSSLTGDFVNRIITPEGYAILSRKDEDIVIADMWFTNAQYNYKALQEIPFPGNTLLVQIRRDGQPIIPHGETRLQLNDNLTIVGNPQSVNDTINLLGTRPDQYCPVS
jgi:Kef-type K+ transport system membrane component KefB/Trk K+ transport system NAD-binding subunit